MKLILTISPKGAIFEGKAPGIISDALMSAMTESLALMETNVKSLTPVGVYGAQGGLLSTIHGEVVPEPGRIVGVVGHKKSYGNVVEMGRRPGRMPPKGSLLRWIEVKLGADENYAKKIEFVIRRGIARKGFTGAGMFEFGWEKSRDQVVEIFDQAGFTIAERLNNE